jgi:hypothetical protein
MKRILNLLMIFLFVTVSSGHAGEKPQILPTPLSDRTFQYLQISNTFMGTPLEIEALVPYALFVIGENESPDLFIQVASMAYMIGQWSQEPGSSVEKVKQNKNLPPILLDKDISDEDIKAHNLVVVGKNNNIYKKLEKKIKGQGSFIEVIKNGLAEGRDVMVVSDRKAAFYLANKRLYFKSGAYKGYFNFVKTRLLIEKGNLDEALFSLDNPEGVRGCGKPVILAIGHKESLSPEMLKVAQKRNKLVFKDLREALVAKDKAKSIKVWESAMETCYACHQGTKDVAQYRKFRPNEGEHSYHHIIVEKFGFECTTCHKGKTENVGY